MKPSARRSRMLPELSKLLVAFLDFGADRSWRAILFRYLLAVVLVGAALYIRQALAAVQEGLQFITFFPAVALASMIAGLGPGLFATALGAVVANVIFDPPTWSVVVFLFDGVIVSAVAEGMRHYVNSYRAAVKDLEKANLAKSEFLAGMSHELRTPLNAVIGFSEIGKMRATSEEKSAEYFQDIHDAGQHLLHLVNDLLDISIIESGKAVLHEQTVDLNEFLHSCVAVMSVRAEQARLTIDLVVPKPVRVRADGRRIKQVVLNLLANAVDFTPEGGRVTVTAGRTSGGGVFVSVQDTGIGMDAETLARVSQPFGGVARTKRHSESSGLGLTVTRFLIELHGGRLELASRVGEGTLATVDLPKERVLEPEPGEGGFLNGIVFPRDASDPERRSPPGSARSRQWLLKTARSGAFGRQPVSAS